MALRQEKNSNTTATITISGILNVFNISELALVFNESFASGVIFFILDLEQIEIVDSAGLGLILKTMMDVEKKNGAIRIFTKNKHLLEILQGLGLRSEIFAYSSLESAQKGWVPS